MFDERLSNTWKRAAAGAPRLSRIEIEGLLQLGARRSGRALASLAWTHVAMLALTVLLALANIYGYRGNATMLVVEGALAISATVLAVFGARILAGLRRIGRADLPLSEMVERRLSLYERWFAPWLVTAALSPWLLALAINTLVDNEHGTYRINHPIAFAVLTAVMVGGTYLMLRLSTNATVREMRAALQDLRDETFDATPRIAGVQRRSRIWVVIGVVLVAIAVLFALLVWLGAL